MKLVAIRIRGETGIKKDIKDTLEMLRLYRKNYCVLLEDTPATRGMLQKTKDFITYGEVEEPVANELIVKKGEEYRGRTESANGKIKYKKFITIDGKNLKPFFRLENPTGGFERKGIKVPFAVGGVLGNRGKKIATLLAKMM